MSNTRITQGHKILVAAGGEAPAVIGQGHKILVAAGGEAPAVIGQSHKIIIFSINQPTPQEPRRPNSMSFIP